MYSLEHFFSTYSIEIYCDLFGYLTQKDKPDQDSSAFTFVSYA